jgi:hypothetical protein
MLGDGQAELEAYLEAEPDIRFKLDVGQQQNAPPHL